MTIADKILALPKDLPDEMVEDYLIWLVNNKDNNVAK